MFQVSQSWGVLIRCLMLQEASIFFKKRATLEEEYGKGLQKLARATTETYATSEGKAG